MEKTKPINVAELLNKIPFDPADCVNAAAMNPLYFRDAAAYRRECLEKKNIAEMQMKRAEAEADLALREEAINLGNKLTENQIKATLLDNKILQKFVDAYNRAEEADEYSRLVVEMFRMRRDSLKVIGDLVRGELMQAQYIERAAENIEETRKKLRQKFPAKG